MSGYDLINAVLEKDNERIISLIVGNQETTPVNIDCQENGITPLWCAINGSDKIDSPKITSDYNTALFLLQQGADPNNKCMDIPYIYRTVTMHNSDLTSLFLNYGADPNTYRLINTKDVTIIEDSQVKSGQSAKCVCNCKTPLIEAIDTVQFEQVEVLLQFGALYNKMTLERAAKLVDIQKTLYYNSTSSQDNQSKRQKQVASIKIHKLLAKQYTEQMEEKAAKYIEANKQFKNKENWTTNLVGLQKI